MRQSEKGKTTLEEEGKSLIYEKLIRYSLHDPVIIFEISNESFDKCKMDSSEFLVCCNKNSDH